MLTLRIGERPIRVHNVDNPASHSLSGTFDPCLHAAPIEYEVTPSHHMHRRTWLKRGSCLCVTTCHVSMTHGLINASADAGLRNFCRLHPAFHWSARGRIYSCNFHESVPARRLQGLIRDAERGLFCDWPCVSQSIKDRDPAEAQGNYQIS
jgi:hypothetical protein